MTVDQKIMLECDSVIGAMSSIDSFVGSPEQMSLTLDESDNIYLGGGSPRSAMKLVVKGEVQKKPKKGDFGMTFNSYTFSNLLKGHARIVLEEDNKKVVFHSHTKGAKMEGHFYSLEYEDIAIRGREDSEEAQVFKMTSAMSNRLSTALGAVALGYSYESDNKVPVHLGISNEMVEVLQFDRHHVLYLQDRNTSLGKGLNKPLYLGVEQGMLDSVISIAGENSYDFGIADTHIFAEGVGFKLHRMGVQGNSKEFFTRVMKIHQSTEKAEDVRRLTTTSSEVFDILDNLIALDDGNALAFISADDKKKVRFDTSTKYGTMNVVQKGAMKGWNKGDSFTFNQNLVRDCLSRVLSEKIEIRFLEKQSQVKLVQTADDMTQVLLCTLAQRGS